MYPQWLMKEYHWVPRTWGVSPILNCYTNTMSEECARLLFKAGADAFDPHPVLKTVSPFYCAVLFTPGLALDMLHSKVVKAGSVMSTDLLRYARKFTTLANCTHTLNENQVMGRDSKRPVNAPNCLSGTSNLPSPPLLTQLLYYTSQ
jgi:hypothetical protein